LWYKAPTLLSAGDHDEVEPEFHLIVVPSSPEDARNYRPQHVELVEFTNEIIIVASFWLFILLYQ